MGDYRYHDQRSGRIGPPPAQQRMQQQSGQQNGGKISTEVCLPRIGVERAAAELSSDSALGRRQQRHHNHCRGSDQNARQAAFRQGLDPESANRLNGNVSSQQQETNSDKTSRDSLGTLTALRVHIDAKSPQQDSRRGRLDHRVQTEAHQCDTARQHSGYERNRSLEAVPCQREVFQPLPTGDQRAALHCASRGSAADRICFHHFHTNQRELKIRKGSVIQPNRYCPIHAFAKLLPAAGAYWIASRVSSSNRSAAPRNAATCFRHALTRSTGQHSLCSSISIRNLSTPNSSPPSFSVSLIPSVYSTTVSPGDIDAFTTSTLSSEKKPSGLQLLSKVLTPDLPASSTGKWPAFASSSSPWFETLPNTRVAYWFASALSWKSRLARTISSATGSRSGISERKTARRFEASMAAATPLPDTSAMMKWRCPSSFITSQ